jgi:hypothetical protein
MIRQVAARPKVRGFETRFAASSDPTFAFRGDWLRGRPWKARERSSPRRPGRTTIVTTRHLSSVDREHADLGAVRLPRAILCLAVGAHLLFNKTTAPTVPMFRHRE